jgi:carbonic anhydrase
MTTRSAARSTAAMLGFALILGIGFVLHRGAAAAAAPAAGHAAATPVTAKEARDRLVAGNARFVAGTSKHGHASNSWIKGLSGGQHPFATVLGCSDSRVPVELVFDQGFGDLFVIRVAGNVVSPEDLGSIEYAVHHLHTQLIVVMGHESCGAVTSALLPDSVRAHEAKGIQQLLDDIQPALTGIDPKLSAAERVHRGVEANVWLSIDKLSATAELTKSHEGPAPTILGAVYDIGTGKVRWLERKASAAR